MYSRTSADHLHCVECDVQEGSVICLGSFFKEMVYEGKQWEGAVGAVEAHGFRGGGPSVCGRCCCVGPGRGVMVTRFIEKTDHPSVSSVKSFSCPFRIRHPRQQEAAFAGGVGVSKLRAVVLCTG